MNFVKLQDTKLIHRNLFHFYTNNKRAEREIKETVSSTTASKSIKYLGINLPKETKGLYSGLTLMKEIKQISDRKSTRLNSSHT